MVIGVENRHQFELSPNDEEHRVHQLDDLTEIEPPKRPGQPQRVEVHPGQRSPTRQLHPIPPSEERKCEEQIGRQSDHCHIVIDHQERYVNGRPIRHPFREKPHHQQIKDGHAKGRPPGRHEKPALGSRVGDEVELSVE